MPSGTARQLPSFAKDDVGDSEFRQMIGDRASGDAAANNDDIRPRWKISAHSGLT
jgi:hypothetical protein